MRGMVSPTGPADPTADCVSVDLDQCLDDTSRQCADVLFGSASGCPADLLERYPGCLCVTVRTLRPASPHAPAGTRCFALGRGGDRLAMDSNRSVTAAEHQVLAALLHWWLTKGYRLDCLDFVRIGDHSPSCPELRLRRRPFSRSASWGLRGR